MKDLILSKIPAECPWRDTLYWYPDIDSTNTQAKRLANAGAPHGTVIIALAQHGGRGRMGRTFQSPAGGMYLSLILRPNCPARELMHLTCAVAVAAAEAVEQTAGVCPGVKWINDLVWQGKKLGGILTELSVDPGTGLARYAIVGIGINCHHTQSFTADVEKLAVSLEQATGRVIQTQELAARIVTALWQLDPQLLTNKQQIMERYRGLCVTLGKQILVLRGDEKLPGTALDVDADGGLRVAFADGHTETVSSGEVSVRGLWDYL